MSDYEDEFAHDEIIDNMENETVDWGDEGNLSNYRENVENEPPPDENPEKKNTWEGHPPRALSTIQEEESFRSVASRRSKFDAPVTITSVDKNASRSFSEEMLASSFSGPNITSNSADFCVDDVRNIFAMEQEKLDNSGRRLNLPENFEPSVKNVMNCSWDKGPYQWDIKQSVASKRDKSESCLQLPENFEAPVFSGSDKNSPRDFKSSETKRTPVRGNRLRHSNPQFRNFSDPNTNATNQEAVKEKEEKLDNPRRSLKLSKNTEAPAMCYRSDTGPQQWDATHCGAPGTSTVNFKRSIMKEQNFTPWFSEITTSTPKHKETAKSRLPEWELSAIDASYAVKDRTDIGMESHLRNIQSIPASSNPNDLMAQLEKMRLQRLEKTRKREIGRLEFTRNAAPRPSRQMMTTVTNRRNVANFEESYTTEKKSTPVFSQITTSTPKNKDVGKSRLPEWELSAINNTIKDRTDIGMESHLRVVESLPARSGASELMATLEKMRLDRLERANRRDRERQEFARAAPRIGRGTTTTMPNRGNETNFKRLSTVEEEHSLAPSTRSSRTSSFNRK